MLIIQKNSAGTLGLSGLGWPAKVGNKEQMTKQRPDKEIGTFMSAINIIVHRQFSFKVSPTLSKKLISLGKHIDTYTHAGTHTHMMEKS